MVDRRLAARSAIGSVRAEGLEPSPEVIARLEAHAEGRAASRELAALELDLLERHRAGGRDRGAEISR